MRHLYVHVPFCARRCVYCDFAIAVRRTVPGRRFVEAVLAELDLRLAREAPARAGEPRVGDGNLEDLETLYLGGGTPSRLEPLDVVSLIQGIRTRLGPRFRPIEVTLEANPEDVTGEAAAAWRDAGVNRVSLGVQSFDPAVLRWMHRSHTTAAAERAVRALRDAGLANLSLDLIFGLPEEFGSAFRDTLERALALDPDHLSVYGLTVEPSTPLARWVAAGRTRPASEDRYRAEFLLAHERLSQAGFEHYEISNYAREGRRAVHNAAYWRGHPYLGLGPSAHSFKEGVRQWNVRDWARYERMLRDGGDVVEGHEVLAEAQVSLERVYLGLRTREGIPRDWLPANQAWKDARAQGWLVERGRHVALTLEGWLRIDELVPRLTTWVEGG